MCVCLFVWFKQLQIRSTIRGFWPILVSLWLCWDHPERLKWKQMSFNSFISYIHFKGHVKCLASFWPCGKIWSGNVEKGLSFLNRTTLGKISISDFCWKIQNGCSHGNFELKLCNYVMVLGKNRFCIFKINFLWFWSCEWAKSDHLGKSIQNHVIWCHWFKTSSDRS